MAQDSYTLELWELDDIKIRRVLGWWQKPGAEPMFEYQLSTDKDWYNEAFYTLEMAYVSAVAAKYTGHRGAGGTGVDTAAGWFAKMIGMPTER